ncbi:MAG TPA: hypothetical protein VFN89_07585 [Solirubrobacterales bacterium]|nr:hypothetical protein [Solirubrobacterales bacterium]
MGILDDAIKEHLELKRQHGAAEDELKKLEDEAFGAAERPGSEESVADPLAEAPTEFMTQPDLEEEGSPRSRRPDVADLQEAPPRPAAEEPPVPPEPPAEEESPAMEHEAVPEAPPSEPEIPTGPTTEEREAIAEQPTEMFDVEEELAVSRPAPTEEELVEEEIEEPRLAPVDPLAGLDADEEDGAEDEYEEDDDFWDEKRLSDELDQALEAPSEAEEEDVEIEVEEVPYEDASTEAEEEDEPRPGHPEQRAPSDDEEDVLEETPDFLEEAPEDDQLWFEQKPPKDFDFDD